LSDAAPGEEDRRPLILDACVVLNLFATRRMDEILHAQGVEVLVAERVRKESLKVGHGRADDVSAEPELVNLAPFIESGILQFARLNGNAEFTAFVRLARDLDDGEAECGAIAMCRGWRVATDDKKARRVFAGLAPAVTGVRTSEMIRVWVERAGAAADVVRDALRDIRVRARFEPPPTDPLWQWWMKLRPLVNESAD